MHRDEFLEVSGIKAETFDQLESGAQIQLLNAVGHALSEANNPEDAQKLVTEAIRTCCENWQRAMQTVARFVAPPGESDSVANLEDKLSKLKQKVGLAEPQAT